MSSYPGSRILDPNSAIDRDELRKRDSRGDIDAGEAMRRHREQRQKAEQQAARRRQEEGRTK